MTKSIIILLLLLASIVLSCSSVPKLDGTYSSAVDDNTLYFVSEQYHFSKDRFSYNYSSDVSGSDRSGNGRFKQDSYKAQLTFDKAPSRIATKGIVKRSPPEPHTFDINIRVKAKEESLYGANIQLFTTAALKSKYYNTDQNGSSLIRLSNDQVFPMEIRISFIGFEPYTFSLEKPENIKMDVILQPSVTHIITSVTKEKDIRKKGSYIYINGKKFKKIRD